MTTTRNIARITLAALLALLLLAACAYMLRGLFAPNNSDSVVLFDPRNPEASRHDSHYAQWMARYEGVPLARIPWVRDPASQQSVEIHLASIPTIRRRPDPARPDHAVVPLAAPTWARSTARPEPASVYLAELPRIRPRRIVRRPDPVHVSLAEMPTLTPRRDPARPAIVSLPPAALPWTRNAGNPQPAEVSPAQVPSALTSSTVRQRK